MRLFFAIGMSEGVKHQIAEVQNQLKQSNTFVKWETPDKFHITIKFLGETGENIYTFVEKSLDTISEKFPSFLIKYKNVGFFPNTKQPKVIWVGSDLFDNTIYNIKKYLDIELEKYGFEIEDRKFHPHITLGRIKDLRNIKNLISIAESLKFETTEEKCGEIILMQSILKPTGSEYKILKSVKLKD